MLKVVTKNPKMSSWDLQQALATVDVTVHASTMTKRLHKFNFSWEVCKGEPFTNKARLKFARENIDKDQEFSNNVLWTDESKIELFGH